MAELWMVAVLVVVVCLLAGTGWSRLFLLASYVCCGVPARAATAGYGIVAAQPSSRGEAASSAAYSPCSHTALRSHSTITIF